MTNMRQAIFYSLTEAELFDHSLMRRGLADIAARGFDSVYLEFRNVRSGQTTPRVRRAIAAFIRLARAHRLGVVADAVYRVNEVIKPEAPELFTDVFIPHRLPVRDGRFTITLTDEVLHNTLERCCVVEEAASQRVRSSRDVTSRVVLESAVTDGGGCAMTEAKGPARARLTYRIRGVGRGEVIAVLRRRFEYAHLDLSHPKLRRYIRQRLAMYQGLTLDGFAWDEPHFGFAFWREDGRSVSDNLLRLFRRRFGYDLQDRLIDLWWDRADGTSARTRLHYAELLEEALAALERDFARRTRGVEFLGIHRTMHEETGDDFYIGCSDYFRHNRYTRGAFTDSVFEREDSMVTMLHLARSLAVANGGPAWNNSWGFVPEERHHAFYLRLMGAMQVRWIGHTYHSSQLFGPGYPHHPLWNSLPGHLTAHRALLKALDGADPATDTAVVYNWRAMATFAGNYLHVHRRNLLLLAKTLTQAQVQFRFVDVQDLNFNGVKRIVVPWPDFLPAGCLARLAELARGGVKVLMFGPPAAFDAEGGSVAAAFARLCGIRRVRGSDVFPASEGELLQMGGRPCRLEPTAIESNYRSNERGSYPAHLHAYDLKPLAGTEVVATFGKRVVGVCHQGVTYLSVELPHFAGAVACLQGRTGVAQVGKKWTVFEYQRGEDRLLAGVAQHGEPHSANVHWQGTTTRVPDCRSFVLRERGGRVTILYKEAREYSAGRCGRASARRPACLSASPATLAPIPPCTSTSGVFAASCRKRATLNTGTSPAVRSHSRDRELRLQCKRPADPIVTA